MPFKCIVYRFPDGSSEYLFQDKQPVAGDAVVRRGQAYSVKSVEVDRNGNVVVSLRSDDDDVEAAWLRLS